MELACNGLAALERMIAAHPDNEIDMVFLDLNMPIMDGCETCRRFREFEGDYKSAQTDYDNHVSSANSHNNDSSKIGNTTNVDGVGPGGLTGTGNGANAGTGTGIGAAIGAGTTTGAGAATGVGRLSGGISGGLSSGLSGAGTHAVAGESVSTGIGVNTLGVSMQVVPPPHTVAPPPPAPPAPLGTALAAYPGVSGNTI